MSLKSSPITRKRRVMVRKPIKRSGWRLKPSKRAKKAPRTNEIPKNKPWSLKRADIEFRAVMLTKVPHQCVFPGCQITDPNKLTVSHYFGRAKKGTRFVVLNCCLLCRNHHYWDKQLGWEFQKQRKEVHGWDGKYTLYMKENLAHQFKQIEILSQEKIGPKKAIQQFQNTHVLPTPLQEI